MKNALPQELQDEIGRAGVIAVLEIEDEKNAVPAAKALLEGGITAIELALRTPASVPSIGLIAGQVPQMFIGIGTVIEPGQAAMLKKQAGVKFAVSPGINAQIVREALEAGLPFAPGIATPSDIELAISLGCKTLKFFPAEGMGGLDFLKNINAPYNHLGLKYIPLGGISPENLADYAKFPAVLAVGGSWIANKELQKAQDWKEISKRAKAAKETWESIRGKA
ncbi:MAG: bifunctional 4-hydroxy-2-oxoglutarate aldolase/2-dehydro-3-deoxy-phosphogluconate aldolase [Spirochaetes bacterium]|nr:bifunctional 4-hydroxy-2-oxoglutarate aldolase/2-dehydro-3-deoxy-phosphogluconate aldolase [Spirochaetota bacterium]